MNKFQAAGAALVALSMGFSSLAIAQDRDRGPSDRQSERRAGPPDRDDRGARNDRGPDRRDGANRWDGQNARPVPAPAPQYRDRPAPPQAWSNQDRRGNWRSEGRHDNRRDGRYDNRYDGRNDGRENWRHANRGAGPNHSFYRGGRLSSQYRSPQYVVEDWRGHRLSSPPRGYHWVQTGGDYVLVAIATGIILQILLNQ